MLDQVRTIRSIVNEHETIGEQVRQALRSIENWQISLESTIVSGESPQVESLSREQWRLVQAIDSLEQGMIGHYGRVERELLEFIGPVLSKALRIQHREVSEQLRNVRLLLTDTDLKALNMTELAAKYPNVKKELEDTYRLIGEHGRAEDVTLRLLLKGVIARD